MRRAMVMSVVAVMIAVAVPAWGSAVPVGWSFDDIESSVHRADIEALGRRDISRGCNPPANDLYCPGDEVTRGQMAAFLGRAINLPPGTGDPFVDDDGSIFEADIEALREADITRGCNPPVNDRYCPDDSVTRGQMAAFLFRAFSLTPAPMSDSFVDDDDSIFEAEIEAIAAAGITLGCNPPENDRFCPDDPVTREQMASFLVRGLDGVDPFTPADPADWYLHADGVGSIMLGTETEAALLEFALLGDAEVEGDPDDDTGWIDSFSVYGTCPGSEIRVVRWGNLEVFSKRDAMSESGEFFAYRVMNQPFWTDLRLRTEEGMEVDETVSNALALYGDRMELTYVDPFDFWLYWIDGSPPVVYDGLGGSLSGNGGDDLLTTIEAGERCGE